MQEVSLALHLSAMNLNTFIIYCKLILYPKLCNEFHRFDLKFYIAFDYNIYYSQYRRKKFV